MTGPDSRVRVGVLISGRGSNMRALLSAAGAPDYPARIALVLSDRADAEGLDHARAAGIPTAVVSRADHGGKEAHEAAIDAVLREHQISVVCLAGFMRLLSADFLAGWPDRVLNIHPSLLPAFKGLDTHARVLATGARVSGCTVHVVRPAMDAGPIIAQAVVPVLPGDDPDLLAGRVLAQEHRLYPLALAHFAAGRVTIEGDLASVRRDGGEAPEEWAHLVV